MIYVASMSAILILALAAISGGFVVRELRKAEAANPD